jgi:hypothetical protein
MREHTNIKLRQMLADGMDDKLRAAELAFIGADTPRHRADYAKQLRRAGRDEEANTLESTPILTELISKIRWPGDRPDAAEIARLVRHYTPDEIRALIASNTPNRLNLIGNSDAVYHRTLTMADGSPRRYRITGKMKTWKTRTGDFRRPAMYGGFNRNSDGIHLTPSNVAQYMIDPDGP